MRRLIRIFGEQSYLFSEISKEAYSLSFYDRSCQLKNSILVYDSITLVVYYQYVEKDEAGDVTAGFLAPYISENGKYCRFIDNKLVEIG